MFPETMIPTLLACLILTGIHVYLGIHVVARKVIFVDLALAQIAALGTVVGIALGYEPGQDNAALYLYSLGVTAAGALVFSVTKMRFEKVPHEAIIGIVYAVAFAVTLLLLSKLSVGPQEIDRILKGDILYLNYDTVLRTALIYAAVGIFHYLMRKPFLELSFNHDVAAQAQPRHMLFDFLFYMSFGFVVTSSVAIAGVFLVFSYLVIPSVAAMLFSDRLGVRLAIGWTGGSLISIAGVWISYHHGLPTSPTIVCLLAGALVIGAVVHAFRTTTEPKRVLMRLGVAAGGLVVLLGSMVLFAKPEEDLFEHALHQIGADSGGERIQGLRKLAGMPQRSSEWLPRARELLGSRDSEVRKEAIRTLARFPSETSPILNLLKDADSSVRQEALRSLRGSEDPRIGTAMISAAQSEEDPDLRIALLDAATELGRVEGIDGLLAIWGDSREDEISRQDAKKHVLAHLEIDPGHARHGSTEEWWKSHGEEIKELVKRLDDPHTEPEVRINLYASLREYFVEALSLKDVQDWWKEHRTRVVWNPSVRKFLIR